MATQAVAAGRDFGAPGFPATACAPYNPDHRRPTPGLRSAKAAFYAMANIFVCLFAVMLCLSNAVIWAFISEMPFVGLCWVGAAAFCLFLQKWAKG